MTIIAAAKKETAKAVKDAMPTIADMVQSAVDAKEIKTIADTAITIRGDKGDKGDKGDAGPKGEDGKDGQNGRDGIDGANGKDGKDGKDAIAKARLCYHQRRNSLRLGAIEPITPRLRQLALM